MGHAVGGSGSFEIKFEARWRGVMCEQEFEHRT